MSEKTKLNLKLLRKVRNRIASIPESYDQATFYEASDKPPCGAAACLAGETVIVAADSASKGIRQLRAMNTRFFNGEAIDHPAQTKARKLLGLSEDDADAMFDGEADGWPQPFRSRFQRAKQPATRANIAVGYLDECLKRKRVTW